MHPAGYYGRGGSADSIYKYIYLYAHKTEIRSVFESLGNFKNIYNFARWIVKDETLGDIFADDKTKASVEKLKRDDKCNCKLEYQKAGNYVG